MITVGLDLSLCSLKKQFADRIPVSKKMIFLSFYSDPVVTAPLILLFSHGGGQQDRNTSGNNYPDAHKHDLAYDSSCIHFTRLLQFL
jgi:hypothetical protein